MEIVLNGKILNIIILYITVDTDLEEVNHTLYLSRYIISRSKPYSFMVEIDLVELDHTFYTQLQPLPMLYCECVRLYSRRAF